MKKGNKTKKAYIDAARQLIGQDCIDQGSIRKIAEMTGFSVGNLYRHFESFDELILYATVLRFQEYFFSAEEMSHEEVIREDPVKAFMAYEALFAENSFTDPKLMHNLYFGSASKDTPRIIQECLALYYPDTEDAMPTLDAMRDHCELEERYADMLQLYFGKSNRFSQERLRMLSTCIFYLYRGFLQEAVQDREYAEHAGMRKEKYLSCVRMLLERFINEN